MDVDEAALKTEECKVKAPDTWTCITYSEVICVIKFHKALNSVGKVSTAT